MQQLSFFDEWAMWEEIVRLVRAYALRKYGDGVDGITLHLHRCRPSYEPFPPPGYSPQAANGAGLPSPRRGEGTSTWGTGSSPKHLSDFQLVYWPGLGTFSLGDKQARVVERLWEAWEEGRPGVKQAELLRAADSDGDRLRDLFRSSNAWGTLIIRGEQPGTYSLPPVAADEPPANEE